MKTPRKPATWTGLAVKFKSRPVTTGVCVCGGTVVDRGIGKMPTQCDKCRLEQNKQRALARYREQRKA